MVDDRGTLGRDEISHDDIVTRLGARFHGSRPRGFLRGVDSDDRSLDGDVFVAIRGDRYDGHFALPHLADRGVRAVVGENDPPPDYPLPYYQVESTRRALAVLEQASCGDPAEQLRIYGVTGTNGKSTTVRILAAILEAAGRDVGWMSTVSRRLGGDEETQSLTTPEPRELARGMRTLVDAGGTDLVLEVSSHALHQERVAGIEFDGAILTNLSHDHLDYHGTIDEYLDCKLDLFRSLKPAGCAVLPKFGVVSPDDHRLSEFGVRFFSIDEETDGYPRQSTCSTEGTMGTLRLLGGDIPFTTALLGRHNLENILAAALLARVAGIEGSAIARGITRAPRVRGRLEQVQVARGRAFVDYAHTPDALESVLGAVREVTRGRLCVVFGCGGDRDRDKRPLMGAIAERLADVVCVTSDNPRGEEPIAIIDDIVAGMQTPEAARVELDRRRAIESMLADLGHDDILVVAGKGHEQQQLIGKTCLPFDDRAVILDSLERSASE